MWLLPSVLSDSRWLVNLNCVVQHYNTFIPGSIEVGTLTLEMFSNRLVLNCEGRANVPPTIDWTAEENGERRFLINTPGNTAFSIATTQSGDSILSTLTIWSTEYTNPICVIRNDFDTRTFTHFEFETVSADSTTTIVPPRSKLGL